MDFSIGLMLRSIAKQCVSKHDGVPKNSRSRIFGVPLAASILRDARVLTHAPSSG